MRQSEIRSNANSVTKWHWEKRADFVASRKAFCEKQRQRAYLSHKARKKNNNTKIWKATRKLRKEGKPVTKSAVAEMTGIARQSVSRRIVRGNVEEAQSMSAKRTNEIRKATTEEKIKRAFEQALKDGIKPTQKSIAKISAVGIATVKRYWKKFKDYQV